MAFELGLGLHGYFSYFNRHKLSGKHRRQKLVAEIFIVNAE